MLQGLVMAIATQICTLVVIREFDDYTLTFTFQRKEGVNKFIAALEAFDGIFLVSNDLSVVVTFAQD